jgi:hypothetical protein
MDGVHVEVNTLVKNMVRINVHDASHTSLPEVATYLVTSTLTWKLFKLPIDMHARAVCKLPSQGPTFLVPNPSPHVEASSIVPIDDESFLTCLGSKCKYYAMDSQTALVLDNSMAQVPHAANAKGGSQF